MTQRVKFHQVECTYRGNKTGVHGETLHLGITLAGTFDRPWTIVVLHPVCVYQSRKSDADGEVLHLDVALAGTFD